MSLHTVSGRLVTDGDYQSASQNIGLIRLIFVTFKVSINGIRNVTAVNEFLRIICKIHGEVFIFMQDSAQALTVCETTILPVSLPNVHIF